MCGYPVLAIWGGNMLCLLSDKGKKIFMNEVENADSRRAYVAVLGVKFFCRHRHAYVFAQILL